jgi:hypothetical protein
MPSTLPDQDTAYDTLFNGVQQRVFFQKMASRGYTPQNAQQAQTMLDTAGRINAVAEHTQVKTAAAQNDPYAMAGRALDAVLGQVGLDGPIKQAQDRETANAYQNAAYYFAQDPAIYNSVLAMKAAEAQAAVASSR